MLKTFLTPGFHWLLVIYAVIANGQSSTISVDSTIGTFDTLHIKFPKTYWFNSYKFSIGDYAKGKSKQGINSSSHKTKRTYSEDKTTYKFTITLESNRAETALIKGEFLQYERYVVSNGGFLEALTGIESESTEYIGNSSKKTVTITTSINEAESWSLLVFDNDSEDTTEILPTLLRTDTRTILVESARGATDYRKLGIYSYGSYTFIENDIVLGSILIKSGNIILLRKDLDPQTKLVITSAIMALVG